MKASVSQLAAAVLSLGLGTCGLALAADAPATPAEAAAPAAATSAPSLGAIELDRAGRRFSLAGRFTERAYAKEPGLLEYFAVKRAGYKAYEALVELDTTATEFNLACILIGLDASHATLPEHHFDPRPVAGDPVDLLLEWEQDGTTRQVRPAELILVEGKPATDHDWVYTGSTFVSPGNYLAEQSGTLIGFIHDADSIIEHRRGIALGAPQPPTVNPALLPPPGTPIRLIVRNPAATPGPSPTPAG